MDTLRDFILAEMRKRYMSEREFGRLVGVAHTTIGYVLNPERSKGRELTASFVIKLARATNTNVMLLFALAYPETKPDLEALVGLSTSYVMRAKQLEKLPDAALSMIDAFLLQAAASNQRSQTNYLTVYDFAPKMVYIGNTLKNGTPFKETNHNGNQPHHQPRRRDRRHHAADRPVEAGVARRRTARQHARPIPLPARDRAASEAHRRADQTRQSQHVHALGERHEKV